MSPADVKHQGYAQRLIQRAIAGARVPHAYLFHGPRGVGKETLAHGLAQLLVCSEPVEQQLEAADAEVVGVDSVRRGCGQCEDCRLVAARTHPDLHLIYRQLNRDHPDPVIRKRKALDIGVDVLRHFVIDRIGYTPARGRSKVFIIREADKMTPAAQNALLKTLEEPPKDTVLILLVTAVDRLLPTTLSRSQVVRFDALPASFVHAKLTELLANLPAEQIEWYARCADGSLGVTLERANDELYELNGRVLDGLARLHGCPAPSGGGGQRPDELVKIWTDESKALGDRYRKVDPDITDTEATRRGFKTIFFLAATWYADILRLAAGDAATIVNADRRAQLEHVAKTIDPERAADAIQRITLAERQLDLNANTQLCIETLVNDLATMTVVVRDRGCAPTT